MMCAFGRIHNDLKVVFWFMHATPSHYLVHSSLGDREDISITHRIIIIKSGVWPICHCLGVGHETMVCAVCLYIVESGVNYSLCLQETWLTTQQDVLIFHIPVYKLINRPIPCSSYIVIYVFITIGSFPQITISTRYNVNRNSTDQ